MTCKPEGEPQEIEVIEAWSAGRTTISMNDGRVYEWDPGGERRCFHYLDPQGEWRRMEFPVRLIDGAKR